MNLIDVADEPDAALVLYELLKERRPEENISHRSMPNWEEHRRFVTAHPYSAWYLIAISPQTYVGAIYLSKLDEISVHLFRNQQKRGYGRQAIELLMEAHPRRRYLANINPKNMAAREFLLTIGFWPVQTTMEYRP